MQRRRVVLCFFLAVLLVCLTGRGADAGKWKKYDNFNNASQIDTEKWEIRDWNGTIEIENGRAKFVRIAGNPRTEHHLVLNSCPESIIGIKATIEVEADCKTTDNEVGIFFHIGRIDHKYSGVSAYIDPDRNWIAGNLPVFDQNDDYNYRYNLFWSMLADGADIFSDGPFTISAIYAGKKVIFEVEGYGSVIYDIPEKVGSKLTHWARIGDWSKNGEGTCTFYVDDVYVMRKGGCDRKAPKVKKTDPKKNHKKVPRNTQWLEIKFSEPMLARHSVTTSGGWPLSGNTPVEWKDGTTFRISRDNAGEPLPPDSTIEVVLNAAADEFQDLKGHPLKKYTFKFQTGR